MGSNSELKAKVHIQQHDVTNQRMIHVDLIYGGIIRYDLIQPETRFFYVYACVYIYAIVYININICQ